MKQIWLEKDGTLQILTEENLDDVKRVLVTRNGSLYGGLFYPDSDYEDVVPSEFHDRCMQIEIAKRRELERPKGEWIKRYRNQINSYCSVCNREVGHRTDFCPNCGAEMLEEPKRLEGK